MVAAYILAKLAKGQTVAATDVADAVGDASNNHTGTIMGRGHDGKSGLLLDKRKGVIVPSRYNARQCWAALTEANRAALLQKLGMTQEQLEAACDKLQKGTEVEV